MKVRAEIEKYAAKEHKKILLWLFERNHWASQWTVVADCTFEGHSPNARRIWRPSQNGLERYFTPRIFAALKRLREDGIEADEDITKTSDAAKEVDALFEQMESLDFWLSRTVVTTTGKESG